MDRQKQALDEREVELVQCEQKAELAAEAAAKREEEVR